MGEGRRVGERWVRVVWRGRLVGEVGEGVLPNAIMLSSSSPTQVFNMCQNILQQIKFS